MTTDALEHRLTTVEEQIAELKEEVAAVKEQRPSPGWEKMFGIFAHSEGFEEAVRLGAEYRQSLRPKNGGSNRRSR